VVRFAGPSAPTLTFYLHGELRVTEITAGGEKVPFEQERVFYPEDYSLIANRTVVAVGARDLKDGLQIAWSGFMHPSAARSPSDYMRIDRDGVFLRARSYSPWFPIFAEPGTDAPEVSFDRVTIAVPAGFTAVFAGTMVSRSTREAMNLSVWSARSIDLFSGQLTARPFEVRGDGEVFIYSLPNAGSKAAADEIEKLTRELLRIYRARYRSDAVTGQAHIVEMPKFGDISSGNVVGLEEESWKDFATQEWAQRTLAHELVHPFVQPDIPRSDPLYAMAIEGFPSYFHLPALAEIRGQDSYEQTMRRIAQRYLEKKQTGTTPRGLPLPPEKPLIALKPEEIGQYKDVFVLSDRALLFLDDLRRRMGRQRFDRFTADLFNRPSLDLPAFRKVVLKYLPKDRERLRVWLETTDYPDELRLK
jgi:hypothetical protein